MSTYVLQVCGTVYYTHGYVSTFRSSGWFGKKKVRCNKRQQSVDAEYPHNLDSTAFRALSVSPPEMSTRKWQLDRLLIISAVTPVLARIIRDDEDWPTVLVIQSKLRFDAVRSLSSQFPLAKLLIFKIGVQSNPKLVKFHLDLQCIQN
jgi:hypothetical protein